MKIFQIEITNVCDLRCEYCPRTEHMHRKLGVMDVSTIDRCVDLNTSPRVRLHHFGESLLFPARAHYAVKAFVNTNTAIEINTNGVRMTVDVVRTLFDSGLDKLNVSYHLPESLQALRSIPLELRPNISLLLIGEAHRLEDFRIYAELGYSVEIKRKRDLGQIKGSDSPDPYPRCSFLDNNEFVVLWDGRIATCCEVYEGEPEEILGSVYADAELLSTLLNNKRINKCRTCLGYGNLVTETERLIVNFGDSNA